MDAGRVQVRECRRGGRNTKEKHSTSRPRARRAARPSFHPRTGRRACAALCTSHTLTPTHTPILPILITQKELREIERDTKSGVSVSLKSGSDMTKLTGFVEGPRDTPYEGGYFVVDIELGQNGEMEG